MKSQQLDHVEKNYDDARGSEPGKRKKSKLGDDSRILEQNEAGIENVQSSKHAQSWMASFSVLHLNPFTPCRSIEKYQLLNHIKTGSYGKVFKAKERASGEVVAVKKLEWDKRQKEVPITGYREIDTLQCLSHHGIVHLREVVVGSTADQIFLVMEYMEYDLKGLIEANADFSPAQVKSVILQILSAVEEMHSHWIIHRDLKSSNLLMNNRGQIKIADFGLARCFADPLPQMTPLVVTLWNRCPELLLGSNEYGTEVDMWSVGCIFGELVHNVHPFQGRGEIDQLFKIFEVLGCPNTEVSPELLTLPHASRINFASSRFPSASMLCAKFPELTPHGLELMTRLLSLSPDKRIDAADAVRHSYFTEHPYAENPNTMEAFLPKDSHHLA